jgi:hypothetical protein
VPQQRELMAAGSFVEGQEVDRTIAKLVPVTAVGRMLEPDKAHKLRDQFERRISRRASARPIIDRPRRRPCRCDSFRKLEARRE